MGESDVARNDLLPPDDAAAALGVDAVRGLGSREAAARLGTFGPNEAAPPAREGWTRRVVRHVADPMAVLLIVAAAVSAVGLGQRLEAGAILAIVILNVAIGFVQEGRAARALEALREMETPLARVRREGRAVVVPAREVVPGDVVLLAAGDRVPADLRLGETAALEVDESLLTGESLPVTKDADASPDPDAGLADRPWTAFSGTLVTRGTGLGVVTATGQRTALGAIARHLSAREPATPLQLELRAVGARLGTVAVVIAAAVFGLTLLRTGIGPEGIQRAFLTAVALAVAAVPEGLATVVTVALALGVRRMAAGGAIVRRLPAVETLGSTTLILTDKTGTLTANRLRVQSVALPGGRSGALEELGTESASRVAEVAALCNDATLDPPAGDRLDLALLEAVGWDRAAELRRAHPRLSTVPFDAERRLMTTVHRAPRGVLVLTKGAPEAVLERSVEVTLEDGRAAPLGRDARVSLLARAAGLAARGARVIALARRVLKEAPQGPEDLERDLAVVALVALRDPVRPEAASAVADAGAAGIRIVMVTGDHPGTAAAIAEEAGLAASGAAVRTGRELRVTGIPADPPEVSVYARVEPDQKLALVEAAQAAGHVVAVTGDGVNDAPALKRADIGVAMGAAGSDVAREAADMIVTDDNLATIVTAVREGRGIYDNIRKVVDYLVAGNLSEIGVVVGALLLFPELGVPLLPLQLLWVNLLTDGLPAIALGADRVDPGLMTRPPRPRRSRLLRGRRLGRLALRGLLIAAAALASLGVARFVLDEPWAHARALMFTVLVVAHILYAFAARLPTRGVSPWLLVAVGSGLLLQLLVIVWPPARSLFATATLSASEWVLVLALGLSPAAVMVSVGRRFPIGL